MGKENGFLVEIGLHPSPISDFADEIWVGKAGQVLPRL